MLIRVYQIVGSVTRSVASAMLVAEVEQDEMPEDQVGFAAEYGGDFIEVTWEEELIG